MAKLPIKLVGLTGLAGSGKDTVANIMATHFGYRKFAFADPLYLEIADAFEVEVIDLNRRDCKETDVPYLSLSRCRDKNFVNSILMLLCEKTQRDGADFDYHKELSAWRSPRWTLRGWWPPRRWLVHGRRRALVGGAPPPSRSHSTSTPQPP